MDFSSLTEIIRQKGLIESPKNQLLKKLGVAYFCYLYIIVVFIIAIFWRISISMLFYVLATIIYITYTQKHMIDRISKDLDKDPELLMQYRMKIWKTMMALSMFYIILSFCSFCIKTNIFGNDYTKVEWGYFIMGFSIVGDGILLSSNYQYLLIFIMLTAERHFIDDYIKNGLHLPTQINTKLGFVVKILMESFMPTLALSLAFFKLTVVSVLYSLAVFLTVHASPLKRTKTLFLVILFASFLQYTSLLVNLSKYDSPYEVPGSAEDPPWKQVYDHRDNDVLVFLNLGTSSRQASGLFADLLVIWILSIFFPLFSMAQSEIRKVFRNSEFLPTKRQLKYKEVLYSSVHFAILFIVLIFISESSGFFSLLYCIFCLVCIFMANRILRNLRSFNKYLKLLKYFLIPLMTSELLFQTLFQIPIHSYLTGYDERWFYAFDLVRLWSAGGSEPSHVSNNYRRIYFKIFTLGFILLASWLMNTEDYKDFVINLSKAYKVKARKLAIEIAYHFNNQRVKEMKQHEEEAQRSERDLEILDKNVQEWNLKFHQRNAVEFGINTKRGDYAVETMTSDHLKAKYKPGLVRVFQNYLIGNINPVIFKHFLCRIKLKKNKAILAKDLEIEEEKSFIESGSFLSPDRQDQEKMMARLKRKHFPYILSWKDYLKLLLYFMCSSTQGIVFFFFCLNHYYYASLESLVFPLSVFCYGLLVYPRPNPKYFKIMMIYAEFIFLSKFVLNLYVWDFLDMDYHDSAKTGFNFADNTYSKTLTNYVIFDAICMLALLAHEYYLIRCGMHENTEIEIESLQQAKTRRILLKESRSMTASIIGKTEKRPKVGFSTRIKDFFGDIRGGKNNEKPGFDYYTRTVLIQLFILVFILFFFPQMTGEAESVVSTLVIALIFHIFIMFFERFIYIEVTSVNKAEESSKKSLKLKFYFHLMLVFVIHFLVFWYFPITANSQKNLDLYCQEPYNIANCNNFQINVALQLFYVFYVLYFMVSSLQLKYGSPKTRAGQFVLMNNYNPIVNIVFVIYRGIPFLYEIRTLMDWTFTATALTLMQWFKFEEIYASLYNTKCDQLELADHPRGVKLKKWEKLLKGCCFFLIIMLCLLAPLIIFSSLNPIVFSNPVKNLSVSIGIKTGSMNYYNLLTISTISHKSSVSEDEWRNEDFSKSSQITANDRELTEKFTLRNISDTMWTISAESLADLCNSLNNTSDLKFQAVYVFTRDYPKSQQTVSNDQISDMSDLEAKALFNMTCVPGQTDYLKKKNAFFRVVRLLSTGSSLLPIIIDNSHLKTDVIIGYHNKEGQQVWEFGKDLKSGIELYVISERYSPVTFNFSVITFYISIVYLIGKVLRVIISGGANNIPLVDMPNPDAFINLCSGIYLSRMNGDLYKEEMLYYELIDILRSPELMKMISGSSSIKKKED